MEALAAAVTVCSLCKQIVTWIDHLAEKETLLVQISSTVSQIGNILDPFASATFRGTGEQQLSASIRSVGGVLQRINEDLLVYQSRRTNKVLAFLNPQGLIQKLKEDQRELNHQMVVLIASITAVGYFRDHARGDAGKLVNEVQKSGVAHTYNLLDELHAEDAREFWRDFIGAKASILIVGQITIVWITHLCPVDGIRGQRSFIFSIDNVVQKWSCLDQEDMRPHYYAAG